VISCNLCATNCALARTGRGGEGRGSPLLHHPRHHATTELGVVARLCGCATLGGIPLPPICSPGWRGVCRGHLSEATDGIVVAPERPEAVSGLRNLKRPTESKEEATEVIAVRDLVPFHANTHAGRHPKQAAKREWRQPDRRALVQPGRNQQPPWRRELTCCCP
jgi:hypothetical protein